VNPELFERTKDHFFGAIQKGYKLNGIAVDNETLIGLQKNLVTFSLFKNHHNMRDVASMLTDGGKLRTYADFEKEALKVSVNYNTNWLQSEYQTAVSSAESASQWNDIQKTKGEYTLLKYVTQHDEKVRHEHETFDGTTLPVDHPYWNTHFPPNGFRCRCYVQKLKPFTKDGKAVPVTKKPKEETYSSEFNFNAGKTQKIFGENHTYFKNLDDLTIKRLNEYAQNVSLRRSKWW
jgi:SPP1 gp7 family putative phage head morphogenesis protein